MPLFPLRGFVILMVAVFLSACDDDDVVTVANNSIIDVAVANGSFTRLVAALQRRL